MLSVPGHKGNANQTTMRYHFPPSRMARIKKAYSNKSWCGRGVVGALVHFWWECNIAQLLWKAVQWLTKYRVKLYDPAIPLPGKYARELGTGVQTKMCTRMFTAALFTTTRRGKQPKWPPADDWYTEGDVATQWVMQPSKQMKPRQLLQHGWALRTQHSVREARLRTHVVWMLHDPTYAK